jgi:hypothetical protein
MLLITVFLRAASLIALTAAIAAAAPVRDLDIRTFGAHCSGGDDTRAVQAALDALRPGRTLLFPCMAGITQVTLAKRSRITIAGVNGGGIVVLSQTADNWNKAFTVTSCDSCVIRDLTVEGNNKDTIPFYITESVNSSVIGLKVRNVRQAGAAFLAIHNRGNKYLNNTIQNAGMDRNPGQADTARGMWVGGVSDDSREANVTISGNQFIDISGTALAVHGSGITITGNTGIRLNWACIKVLPLGGSGDTLVAENNCSGAGAKWLIGGGIMTEYYNSSFENTVIRDNTLDGYSAADVARIPDSPSVGINIANPPGKVSHNVKVINNTIRNMLYDGIQISGPTDGFVIEGNLIERTIEPGTQWNGVSLQGDTGKVIANGVIRRNVIRGKFDGIHVAANGGSIQGLTMENNVIEAIKRDGVHVEEQNRGQISNMILTNGCFSAVGRRPVFDNRIRPLAPVNAAAKGGCMDPRPHR